VNEQILILSKYIMPLDYKKLRDAGMEYDSIISNFVFNTEKYFSLDTYNPTMGSAARKDAFDQLRKLNEADGILLIGYRLPTEAEWEYAAFAPVAGKDGILVSQKMSMGL
jgi:hypothetical protein